MRVRNSFWAMLGQDVSNTPEAFERVRGAMLQLADAHCADARDLRHRLTYANDIDALWYLRSPLMAAIAARRGEPVARDAITRVTLLFRRNQPGAKP
jgi:hypothetical protein